MKKLLVLFAFAGLSAAVAQDDGSVAAERARIKSERAAAEAAFQAEEKACYGKFAVNDCLNAAKARRRAAVSGLRRQEIALNDAQRKRKAIERTLESEGRTAGEPRREEAPRAKRTTEHKLRETAPEKPAARPSDDAAAAAKRAQRQEEVEKRKAERAETRERKIAEEARNRQRHEERLAEVEERREKLQKRLASRKKPPAQPLPEQP